MQELQLQLAGWALKCHYEESNLAPLVSLPGFKTFETSNLPHVRKSCSKIASMVILEDAETVCILSDTPPSYRELVGI
jgi:hypothetical protein